MYPESRPAQLVVSQLAKDEIRKLKKWDGTTLDAPDDLPAEWDEEMDENVSLYWLVATLWMRSSDTVKDYLDNHKKIRRHFEPATWTQKKELTTAKPALTNPSKVMAMALHLFKMEIAQKKKCSTCSGSNNHGPSKDCICVMHNGVEVCTNCHSKGSTTCSFRVEYEKTKLEAQTKQMEKNLLLAYNKRTDTDEGMIKGLLEKMDRGRGLKIELEKNTDNKSSQKGKKRKL